MSGAWNTEKDVTIDNREKIAIKRRKMYGKIVIKSRETYHKIAIKSMEMYGATESRDMYGTIERTTSFRTELVPFYLVCSLTLFYVDRKHNCNAVLEKINLQGGHDHVRPGRTQICPPR